MKKMICPLNPPRSAKVLPLRDYVLYVGSSVNCDRESAIRGELRRITSPHTTSTVRSIRVILGTLLC